MTASLAAPAPAPVTPPRGRQILVLIAMIAAVARGIPVRLLTEPQQYRDRTRHWHSWNVDRMYMAGVQIRLRAHATTPDRTDQPNS